MEDACNYISFLNRESGEVRHHLLIEEFSGPAQTDLILVTAGIEEKFLSGTLSESVQMANEIDRVWV